MSAFHFNHDPVVLLEPKRAIIPVEGLPVIFKTYFDNLFIHGQRSRMLNKIMG
jgi:hypothetical protein